MARSCRGQSSELRPLDREGVWLAGLARLEVFPVWLQLCWPCTEEEREREREREGRIRTANCRESLLGQLYKQSTNFRKATCVGGALKLKLQKLFFFANEFATNYHMTCQSIFVNANEVSPTDTCSTMVIRASEREK